VGRGGGTDATARIIGVLLEKELKQPFNVVNRTAARAWSATTPSPLAGRRLHDRPDHRRDRDDASRRPDGAQAYRLHADRLVNADPAAINVRSDSPYKSVKELLAAIKANPGQDESLGHGQGGIWHLAYRRPAEGAGIDPSALPWVPSNAAAPACRT